MRPLIPGEPLSQAFLGGLITVARVDGLLNRPELEVVWQVAAELGAEPDAEELFLSDVGPCELAEHIDQVDIDPRRRGAGGSPFEIKNAFIDAARRVAGADGHLDDSEVWVIAAFEEALGLMPRVTQRLARA